MDEKIVETLQALTWGDLNNFFVALGMVSVVVLAVFWLIGMLIMWLIERRK